MKMIVGLLCLGLLTIGMIAHAQTQQDKDVLRELPRAFSAAFAKRDAHKLAQLMAEDVDFVTVGLLWLRGRADFAKYHNRLLTGRFSNIVHTILDTDVRFIRPDVAVVRHSWNLKGDRNPDGSERPQRFGLMTMVAEKRSGTWLVVAVQNVNSPNTPRSPEAHDIESPIVVPRGQ
jgi:uncharacterized protein (TIGR02246 family)